MSLVYIGQKAFKQNMEEKQDVKIICIDTGAKNLGIASFYSNGRIFTQTCNISVYSFKQAAEELFNILKYDTNLFGLIVSAPIDLNFITQKEYDDFDKYVINSFETFSLDNISLKQYTRDLLLSLESCFAKFGKEVFLTFCDERLSTIEAKIIMKNAKLIKKKYRNKDHSVSAMVILKRFIGISTDDYNIFD